MNLKVTPSTGNVFRDLGFRREEAEHLLVRADLLIQVQKLIASRCLKQREAAALLRISQPRVSDLVRGRIDLFSTDMLIDMLARLGARVRLAVKRDRQNRKSHNVNAAARLAHFLGSIVFCGCPQPLGVPLGDAYG